MALEYVRGGVRASGGGLVAGKIRPEVGLWWANREGQG
jgi:hypothetical protein